MAVNWQPVLRVMYEEGGFAEPAKEDGECEFRIHDPLNEESTGLDRDEIRHGLRFLATHSLIEEVKGHYELTETGLQVAQERTSQERQHRINRTIMLAAIITALGSVLNNTQLFPIF